MSDLKPCPFCGSGDIRFSLKVSGHFSIQYRAVMYCNKCHCYGPRTRTKALRPCDYEGRSDVANDKAVKLAATNAWNRRAKHDRQKHHETD